MPWFSINTKLFQAQIWFEKWYIRVEILHLGSSFWTGHSIVEIFWNQLIKISLGRRGGLKGGSAESESNWTLDIVCYCNQEIFCRGHTHSWLAQYSTAQFLLTVNCIISYLLKSWNRPVHHSIQGAQSIYTWNF